MRALTKAMGYMVAAALGLTAAAGGAYAGEKGAEWPSFQEADKDANGILDAAEALSLRGFNFKAADKDKDGKVSQGEYETAMKEQSAKTKKGS